MVLPDGSCPKKDGVKLSVTGTSVLPTLRSAAETPKDISRGEVGNPSIKPKHKANKTTEKSPKYF